MLLIPELYTRSSIHYSPSNAASLMVLCEKSTVTNYALHTISYITTAVLENALPVSERWHCTVHLLLYQVTFYSDLVYFSPHFVKNVIGTHTQNVAHQNSRKSNQWFQRRHTGTSCLTPFQYMQFKNHGILSTQKIKKNLNALNFSLPAWKRKETKEA